MTEIELIKKGRTAYKMLKEAIEGATTLKEAAEMAKKIDGTNVYIDDINNFVDVQNVNDCTLSIYKHPDMMFSRGMPYVGEYVDVFGEPNESTCWHVNVFSKSIAKL